jgi:hypothetical protein
MMTIGEASYLLQRSKETSNLYTYLNWPMSLKLLLVKQFMLNEYGVASMFVCLEGYCLFISVSNPFS